MRLFGKKKKKEMTPEQTLKAMEDHRNTTEDISKRSTLLQNKAKNELQQALQRKKQGDKAGALICLKRKKMYENEVTKLEGSRMNLEQQLFSIEAGTMNKNIFEGLRQGNEVLKQVHGKINIDEVDKLKDDMEEQQDLVQELNEAISQPIGFMSTMDDDELLGELDDLEAKEYEIGMLDLDAPVNNLQPERAEVVQPQARAAPVKDDLEDMFNEMQMS